MEYKIFIGINSVIVFSLTRFKDYFAEHDPSCRKVQLKLKKTASSWVKLYGNVARLFQHKVRYVREMDRLPVELIPTGAKINLCVGEDLKKKMERALKGL